MRVPRGYWLLAAVLIIPVVVVALSSLLGEGDGHGRAPARDTAPAHTLAGGQALDPAESPSALVELRALLRLILDYRQAGQHHLAEAQRAIVVDRVRTAWSAGTSDHIRTNEFLFGVIVDLFVGSICAGDGEAAYYHDLCVIAAAAMGASADAYQDGQALVDALFRRGVPEEHVLDSSQRHAECVALGPLLRALFAGEITEAASKDIVAATWTTQCPIIAWQVFRLCSARFPQLVTASHLTWIEKGDDPAALVEVARVLIRTGLLDKVIELITTRDASAAGALLQACVAELPVDDSFALLETLRLHLLNTGKRDGAFEIGLDNAYGTWVVRQLEDRGTIHKVATRLLDSLDRFGEAATWRDRTALMNAITEAGSRYLLAKRELPADTGAARMDAEQRLAAAAVRSYSTEIGGRTDELWALAYLVADTQAFLDAAESVLVREGAASAASDIVLGLGVLQERGLLGDSSRARAMSTCRKAMQLCAFPDDVRVLLNFVRGSRAVELVADLEGLGARLQSRKGPVWAEILGEVEATTASLRGVSQK